MEVQKEACKGSTLQACQPFFLSYRRFTSSNRLVSMSSTDWRRKSTPFCSISLPRRLTWTGLAYNFVSLHAQPMTMSKEWPEQFFPYKKKRGQHISIKCNPINIGECRFAANFLLHTELSTRNPNIWASASSQARKSLHCIRSHKFPRNISSRIW